MIEYRDGSFGNIVPSQDIIDALKNEIVPLGEIRAVHFGTVPELNEIAQNKAQGIEELRQRMAEVERQLKPGAIRIYQDIP